MDDYENTLEELKKNSEEREVIHSKLDKFKSLDDIKNNKEEFEKLTEQDQERMKRRQKLREKLLSFVEIEE